MNNIIFVCTGNTCRSPMAEALLKSKLAESHMNIEVISRGIYVNALSANEKAITIMDEKSLDISKHKPNPLSQADIDSDALILTMTKEHETILKMLYPGNEKRIFSLYEFIGVFGDIKDPYGGTLNAYKECANELEELMDKVIDMI